MMVSPGPDPWRLARIEIFGLDVYTSRAIIAARRGIASACYRSIA